MSDIDLRCVSLATGELSPDLRVNYEFGLVMGVDEFRQEQLYFLEKAYLHDRSLHGYGTVHGLNVTTRPEGDDVVITVEPGMAVDQWGRPVVVRSAQCARLGAWLAAEERRHPGAVATHLGPSGELTLFVVATYSECLDALVPVPGQPCSSSEQTQVASRIRDAWNLELRWDPPEMPAWDAVRALATILTSIRFDASLGPVEGDEATIIEVVRNLPGPAPGSPPNVGPWRLPASTALAALDRIFTVWVTEVRPRIAPGLIDPAPGEEAGVLLSAVAFVPDDPFSVDTPRVLSAAEPDDEGRPFLLHTQLIQELVMLGPGADAPPTPAQPPAPTTAQELVTFDTVMVGGNPTAISAWFHLDVPVRLPRTVQVLHGPRASRLEFAATPVGGGPFSVLWQLQPPVERALQDGDLLAFQFDVRALFVGDPRTDLGQFIERGNLEIVGHDRRANVVRSFYQVETTPTLSRGPSIEDILDRVRELPHLPFATISAATEDQTIEMEMWFHPDVDPRVGSVRVEDDFDFDVIAEVDAPDDLRPVRVERVAPTQGNVFRVRIPFRSWRDIGLEIPIPYLRIVFPVFGDRAMRIADRGGAQVLGDYIAQNRIHFEGFNGRDAIVVYVRVPPTRRIG